MQEELYIINTKIDSGFVDDYRFADIEQAMKDHMKFITKVREQHPRFGLPYIALFEDGNMEIPYDPIGANLSGGVRDGVVGGVSENGGDLTLDVFIDQLKSGTSKLLKNEPVITGVVEFSADPLYADVIEKLESKYDIKRISVE